MFPNVFSPVSIQYCILCTLYATKPCCVLVTLQWTPFSLLCHYPLPNAKTEKPGSLGVTESPFLSSFFSFLPQTVYPQDSGTSQPGTWTPKGPTVGYRTPHDSFPHLLPNSSPTLLSFISSHIGLLDVSRKHRKLLPALVTLYSLFPPPVMFFPNILQSWLL